MISHMLLQRFVEFLKTLAFLNPYGRSHEPRKVDIKTRSILQVAKYILTFEMFTKLIEVLLFPNYNTKKLKSELNETQEYVAVVPNIKYMMYIQNDVKMWKLL